MDRTKRVGIDVGGVIMDKANDNTDTSFFSENYLKTSATPGAFEAIRKIVEKSEKVFVVSKCGKKVQEKTLHWMQHNRFFDLTGILPDDVHFCQKRHEKAPICQRLGINAFIDDKLEVLSYMPSVPERLLFKAEPEEVARFSGHLAGVHQVSSWDEVLVRLLQ